MKTYQECPERFTQYGRVCGGMCSVRRRRPGLPLFSVGRSHGRRSENAGDQWPRFRPQAKEIVPDGQIVILTGYGDMNSAVEAMRSGSYDYLTKPVDPDRLLQTLRKADERRRLIIEIVPYSVV